MSISLLPKPAAFGGSFSPEYPLLGLLAQQPAHGYDLYQKLALDLGEVWHVSLSQTYNVLIRLEAQGFTSGSLEEQEKLPARRRFTLTPAGRQRFEAWHWSLLKSSCTGIGCRLVDHPLELW